MSNKITLIFSTFFFFFTISFAADNNTISQNVKKKYKHEEISDSCNSPSSFGQQECVEKKMDIADKELNAAYKALLTKLPEVDGTMGGETGRFPKHGLITAQKAWMKYRDANCQFYGDMHGGAPAWRAVEDFYCRIEMTKSRTKELRKILKDYD
jgi:uncharacterized protein YecT (DUF1311 family)